MKHNLLKYGFVIVLAMMASMELLWADCCVDEIHDTIVKKDTQYIHTTDTIFRTDTVISHDTCFVVDASLCNSNKQSFGYDFLLPLFVSVLGAFIALLLIYLLLRPNFEIYPIAAQSLNNRVWFVVHNKSCFAKLYSVKAELAYITYDEESNDTILEYIELDMDSLISVLGKRQFGSESYYVFHTKSAFIRDDRYEQVRLRVSATNTISNIFDAKDKYFSYSFENSYEYKNDDILWGAIVGDIFVGIDLLYGEENLEKAKRIIIFNERITRILFPYFIKNEIEENQDVWILAKQELLSLKPFGKLNRQFPTLNKIRPTIDQLNTDYDKLIALYTKHEVLSHQDKDERDKLVEQMKREVVRVAQYMQKSLT